MVALHDIAADLAGTTGSTRLCGSAFDRFGVAIGVERGVAGAFLGGGGWRRRGRVGVEGVGHGGGGGGGVAPVVYIKVYLGIDVVGRGITQHINIKTQRAAKPREQTQVKSPGVITV